MWNNAFVLKTMVFVLIGIVVVETIAIIYLGIKRNTYYVDENDQPIRPKKNKTSTKKVLIEEDDDEEMTEMDLSAPAQEETTVVPTTGSTNPIQTLAEVEEVHAAEPETSLASVSGAKVSVDMNGQVSSYVIDSFPCLIGREAGTCNLTIPEPAVSRRHAKFVLKQGQLYIEDVSEHNGTYLNGNKLPPLGSAKLQDGDEVDLGRVAIHIDEILY